MISGVLDSIRRLQQEVANGTMPAYIGEPMVRQLIEKAKSAQSLQQGTPTTTVVDQINQEAQSLFRPQGIQQTMPQMAAASDRPPIPTQVPPQNPMPPREMVAGIDAAQSNLPTQNMASGGIVAFAGEDGSLVDDEYDPEEDDANEEYYAEMAHQSNLAQMIADNNALSEDMLDDDTLDKYMSKAAPNAGTGIKYKEPIPAGASKGLQNKSFTNKIEHLESRGRDYDEKGNILTSPKGAMGSMQTMAGTLRDPGFGVKPAQDNSVAEMKRVGIDYANAMLRRYGNEQDAAMAYNWGPGNVDKWIAGGRQGFVPSETRQYATKIASMAGGGIVALANGGDVKRYDGTGPDKSQVTDNSLKDNEYLQRSRGVTEGVKNLGSNLYNAFTTPRNYDLYDLYQRNIGQPFARGVSNFVNEPLESQAAKFRSYSMTPNQTPTVGYNVPAGSDTPVPTTGMPDETEKERERNRFASFATQNKPFTQQVNQFVDEYNRANANSNGSETTTTSTDTNQKTAEKGLFEQMQDALKKREANLESEKSIDNYLALLQGFLGMMGGTSPYAMANIGQGASSGINTLLAARKQTGQAERALGRDQSALINAKISEDYRNKVLGQNEKKMEALAKNNQLLEANRVRDDYNTLVQNWTKSNAQLLNQRNSILGLKARGKISKEQEAQLNSIDTQIKDFEKKARKETGYTGGDFSGWSAEVVEPGKK